MKKTLFFLLIPFIIILIMLPCLTDAAPVERQNVLKFRELNASDHVILRRKPP